MYYIHINWGYLSLFTGEIEEARRHTTESLRYGQMLKLWHQAISLSVLGIVAYQQGDFQEAHQQLSESLNLWRPVGDPRGLVFAMIYLGLAIIGLQDYARAESILKEGNQIAEANSDRWGHAFGLDLLGLAYLSQDQSKEALHYFQQSAVLYNQINDQLNGALANVHTGEAYAALQLRDKAKQIFLDVYEKAKTNNWTQIILKILISHVEMSKDLIGETKLMVALSILEHPAITPYLRKQCEAVIHDAKTSISDEKINVIETLAKDKSPELWAQELLK